MAKDEFLGKPLEYWYEVQAVMARYIVPTPECLAQLLLERNELCTEVERLRMKAGRMQAANAVWVGLAAYLARNGQQELAKRWRDRADNAAANVRPEDFVVARVNHEGGDDG